MMIPTEKAISSLKVIPSETSGAVHQRGGEVRNDGEEEHHRTKVSDYCQHAMGVEHGAFSDPANGVQIAVDP